MLHDFDDVDVDIDIDADIDIGHVDVNYVAVAVLLSTNWLAGRLVDLWIDMAD